MRYQCALRCVLTAMVALSVVTRIAGAQARREDETERTTAAVIAAGRHWSEAEVTGDTAYLGRLLMPEYLSVNVDGASGPKAAIIAGALKRPHPKTALQDLEARRAAHPHGTDVVISGDIAIVTYYVPENHKITSCDIMVYNDGRWRAIYSQHTAAE